MEGIGTNKCAQHVGVVEVLFAGVEDVVACCDLPGLVEVEEGCGFVFLVGGEVHHGKVIFEVDSVMEREVVFGILSQHGQAVEARLVVHFAGEEEVPEAVIVAVLGAVLCE